MHQITKLAVVVALGLLFFRPKRQRRHRPHLRCPSRLPSGSTSQPASTRSPPPGPCCSSGSFVDDLQVDAGHPESTNKINLLIHTVYTCDDGSGTFNARKHVFITFTDEGFTSTGPIQLVGGTSAYTRLRGHGVDNGFAIGDTGVGQISGFIAPPSRP